MANDGQNDSMMQNANMICIQAFNGSIFELFDGFKNSLDLDEKIQL